MKGRNAFINELVSRLGPEKRAPRPWILALAWWLGSIVACGLLLQIFHMRAEWRGLLGSWRFSWVFFLLIFGAGFGAFIALRSAIPGKEFIPKARAVVWALVAAILVPITTWGLMEPTGEALLIGLNPSGALCSLVVACLAAIPGAGLLLLLRSRFAAVRPGATGAALGFAAGALGAAAVAWHCPVDESVHLIIWHLLPIFALAWITSILARRVLRF